MVLNKRVMGLLAVTRSFGDHSIKEFVIADPYVQSLSLNSDCEFLVMGCDGVFDVLSDSEVCSIVVDCLRNVGAIMKWNVESEGIQRETHCRRSEEERFAR